MGKITVTKIEHFQREWLPWFRINKPVRNYKPKVDVSEINKLKKIIKDGYDKA